MSAAGSTSVRGDRTALVGSISRGAGIVRPASLVARTRRGAREFALYANDAAPAHGAVRL